MNTLHTCNEVLTDCSGCFRGNRPRDRDLCAAGLWGGPRGNSTCEGATEVGWQRGSDAVTAAVRQSWGSRSWDGPHTRPTLRPGGQTFVVPHQPGEGPKGESVSWRLPAIFHFLYEFCPEGSTLMS